MNGVKQPRKYPWAAWHIAFVDGLLMWLSFVMAYYLRYEVQFLRPVDEANIAPFDPFIPYTLIFMAWMFIIIQSSGLYQDRRERSFFDELFRITNAASNAAIIVMALSFFLRPLVFSRLLIVQAAIISILLLVLWRVMIRLARNYLHQRGVGVENVLLVGAGEVGRYVMRTIIARPDLGYRLIGFVDDDLEKGDKAIGRVMGFGATSNLAQVADAYNVDLVIVTLPWREQRTIFEITEACQRQDIQVRVVPDLFQLNMSQIQVEMLGGMPLLGARRDTTIAPSNLLVKRGLDIVLTSLLLLVGLPIMLITAIAIRLDSPGPVLFYQTRVGYKGREFKMIKFRSMVMDAEAQEGQIVKRTSDDPEGKNQRKDDDPRITRVGHFIRRSSIDEFPQLFNILRGEMSLVGPRPALPQEVALYKPWHLQRLLVRPGLTGLWQVSGRSDIPFEEKVLLDIYYIENWSLSIDLQILLQTPSQVLFSKGAY